MSQPNEDFQSTVMSQPTTQSQPAPKNTSYANVTSSLSFPRKDQAIILDSIDGITLREYLVSLSSLIPASSIRFISRISNARICIYLDSKKTADNLIDVKKKIMVKNITLEIRPLVTRNKRIVLSNVCPVIPNYIIEEKFKELKIQILSPISFVKIGVPDPGFAHILSFRRQLYISPEDEKHLPESFQVNFDGTNYWIYISSDSLKCFSCNTTGHIAKNCPKTEPTFPIIPQDMEVEKPINTKDTVVKNNDLESRPILNPTPIITQLSTDQKKNKRIHSPTTSESSKTETVKPVNLLSIPTEVLETDDDTHSTTSLEDTEIRKKMRKKLKKTDTKTDEDTWKEIKNNLIESEREVFPIDVDRFISLLDNTRGKKNIKEIVYSYTDNLRDLIKMCNILHIKLNTSLKYRCSRLTRKLHEILDSISTLST